MRSIDSRHFKLPGDNDGTSSSQDDPWTAADGGDVGGGFSSGPPHANGGFGPRSDGNTQAAGVPKDPFPVVTTPAEDDGPDAPEGLVLVGSIGSNSTSTGTGGGTGSGGSALSTTGSGTTSPFVINVIWDASVNSAPAGFQTGVLKAAPCLAPT